MLRSLVVSLGLLVSVAACGSEPAPTPAPAAPGTGAASSAAAPAASAQAAAPAEAQAAASQESSSENAGSQGEEADTGDASLERLTQLPPAQQLPNGRWKAGVNYKPLVPAQPTSAPPGKVEVVEVFWYGCGHCYALEPFLQSWDKNNAAYIEYVKLPVIWGPVHKAHARLFYTLQALGRERDLTPRVFDEIHQRGNMLVANDEAKTRALQLAFAKANGIAEQDFLREYNGFSVNTRLQQAERLTRAYRVEGVPLVVVNGKYVTDVGSAGGQSELLKLIDDLAAFEQRR